MRVCQIKPGYATVCSIDVVVHPSPSNELYTQILLRNAQEEAFLVEGEIQLALTVESRQNDAKLVLAFGFGKVYTFC